MSRAGMYGVIAVLSLAVAAKAQNTGPLFSLDDNPALPITGPFGPIPGTGAEDPFGWLWGLPGLAPSPTLGAIPAFDSEMLIPGGPLPLVNVAAPFDPFAVMPNLFYINATSNSSQLPPNLHFHIGFSVDRRSIGQGGTDVAWQAGLDQQPGDIFVTTAVFPDPRSVLPLPAGAGYVGPVGPFPGGGNRLVLDESSLGLTAVAAPGTQIGPNVPGAPIALGTHDNVDALDLTVYDQSGDLIQDQWTYFAQAPDDSWLLNPGAVGPWEPAAIYSMQPGNPTVFGQYAPAAQMGLVGGALPGESDDLDALIVFDDPQGQPDIADPQIDFALFSLGPGSISLLQNNLSAADVFITDFNGTFALFASFNDLGLRFVGIDLDDNVDALEILIDGDADLDGDVDGADLNRLLSSYGGAGGWTNGDFNGDGAVNGADLNLLLSNYSLAGVTAVGAADAARSE